MLLAPAKADASKIDPSSNGSLPEKLHPYKPQFLPLLCHPLAAADFLKRLGYPDEPKSMAAEVPAWLGSGMYSEVGLNRAQAVEVLGHYFKLLDESHADTTPISRRIMPDLRKYLTLGK